MGQPEVRDLAEGRKLLDLDFRDTEGLVAAYLLPQPDGWTLIETGPTSCRDVLLAGIGRAGVDPADVRRVFVTHIHLDHAGGVGALAQSFPRATFYAHEIGVPHLIDPSRLIASARRAWGAGSDSLWGIIAPTPASRLRPLRGGERFPLVGGDLEVVATPGHARHHLAYFDHRTGALFTGDAAGVRLEETGRVRPAVPPPELDLEDLFRSVETMRRLEPRIVLFSHFGPSPDGAADLERYPRIVERWRDVALDAARERRDPTYVAMKLEAADRESTPAGPPNRSPGHESLVSGYDLAAQGFLRYFETHGLLPPERP